MYLVKKITEDLYWLGSSDRRLALFENVYPIPRGVSYNSYFIDDEKTILFDTVDHSVNEVFFENLEHLLHGRKLDYVVINHVEPDHCATLSEVIRRYPEAKIVTSKKASVMLKQFFTFDVDSHVQIVKEMDTLCTGKHTFAFVMAPMVHWPEVMVSYDVVDKTLFAADAFGTFGALDGHIYADEYDFEHAWLPDARRYLTNIVGKYGPQIVATLKKASTLEIKRICPLHGPVWRENIGWFIDKYLKWGSYTPEDKAVLIVYGSIYGHTENAANLLASDLADLGVKDIAMYDVSATHPSYILSEAFRCSHLVFASATYNNGIFDTMYNLLHDLVTHNLQNRTIAFMENGTWVPVSDGLMRKMLSTLKGNTFLDNKITLKSSVKAEQREQIKVLAKAIADSVNS